MNDRDPRYNPQEAWELLRMAAAYVYPSGHPQAVPLPVLEVCRAISDLLRRLAAEPWPDIQPVINCAADIIDPRRPGPAALGTRRAIGDALIAFADSYETSVRAWDIIRREFPGEATR